MEKTWRLRQLGGKRGAAAAEFADGDTDCSDRLA